MRTISGRILVAIALTAVVALAGCLVVADGRALYDLEIGSASDGEATIEVVDGHAAVLDFTASRTELWSQAPTLEMTLELPAGPHTLTARNTLADAEWEVTVGEDATPIETTPVARDLPTVKTTTFDGPGGVLTARLRAPDAELDTPWRFVAVADIQDRIGSVQDIYSKMAEDPTIRFGVISGDLTDQGSPEELVEFQEEMASLPFPLYATLGNHELGNGEHLFQDRFGRVNFSFQHRGVRFTLLDSASATLAPPVWRWLEGWLRDGADQAHVVIMHIPPLDPSGTRNGAWASREEAAYFVGELGRGGVDLAIYGHIHTYYAYETAGVPSFITGGGGAIPQRFDGIGRHFLSVEVNPVSQRLDVALVRVD